MRVQYLRWKVGDWLVDNRSRIGRLRKPYPISMCRPVLHLLLTHTLVLVRLAAYQLEGSA